MHVIRYIDWGRIIRALILFYLVPTCCAMDLIRPRLEPVTEPGLESLVNSYPFQVNYHVGFKPIRSKKYPYRAGLCTTWEDGYAEVWFDPKAWATLSDLRRKALVWHELGHCTNGWDHDNRVNPWTRCPFNFMHSWVPDDYCLVNGFTSMDPMKIDPQYANQ